MRKLINRFLFIGFTLLVLWIAIPVLAGIGGFSGSYYLPLVYKIWPIPTPTPIPGRLLISELVPDPAGAEPDGEWVEVYNAGGSVLNLGEHKIGDAQLAGRQEGMYRFPPGSSIAPGQALVIASRANDFFAQYGQVPDFEFDESDPMVPNMSKYTAWASGKMALSNTGDEVLILDELDDIVDEVSWGNSTYFLDPSAPKPPEGDSLERSPADQDTNTRDDWIVQPFPNPWLVTASTPTPTPSPTVTSTITITLTQTPPPTVTPSPSATSTETMRPTSSGTPTPTTSITLTSTSTGTSSPTPTVTLTQTSTSTPTGTATHTRTPTTTPTATATGTSTPTATLTAQPTPLESQLLISEVLYNPAGDEPDGEWIEIYNGGGSTVNLTGVKVGDEESSGGGEGMYQFPDGAQIVSGQVLIIANKATVFATSYGFKPHYELEESDPEVPNLTKYGTWSSGVIYLSNTGDEVLILDVDDSVLDTLSWGSSAWAFDPPVSDVPEGHTLERRPVYRDTDTAEDWADQPDPDPGKVDPPSVTPTPTPTDAITSTPTITPTETLTPTPQDIHLLVSEVLYDPTGDEPDEEWIELYNAGPDSIDLTGIKVGDEETSGGGEGMYQFPDFTEVAPGEVIVVANRAAAFFTSFGFNPDYELVDSDPAVPNMVKYSSWGTGSLYLSNTGDEVLILSAVDTLIDALSWGSSTWAFDPPVSLVAAGHSLERYPAGQDTDSASDWIESDSPSPGEVNLTQSLLTRILTFLGLR